VISSNSAAVFTIFVYLFRFDQNTEMSQLMKPDFCGVAQLLVFGGALVELEKKLQV